MIKTNEKTIQDWISILEDLQVLKTIVIQDILRFEEKVTAYN